MSNNCARLLRLFPRQPARHAHLERRLRLPSRIPWVNAQAEREGLEACDEDAVGKTLGIVSKHELRRGTATYLVDHVAEDLVLIVHR
jgi:hypothetical protein